MIGSALIRIPELIAVLAARRAGVAAEILKNS
jgi:hypothetical protein